MPLTGTAKRRWQRVYMRRWRKDAVRIRETLAQLGFVHASDKPRRSRPFLSDEDRVVRDLARRGFLSAEICDALNISEVQLQIHLDHIAEDLAPTPNSQSVDEVVPA